MISIAGIYRNIFLFVGKLEADDAELSLVYHYFEGLLEHFEEDPVVLAKVQKRWKFIKKDVHGLAYLLTPKFAIADKFIGREKAVIMSSVRAFALRRNPDDPLQADSIMQEAVRYIQDVQNLNGDEKLMVEKMKARDYWDILGKDKFPLLYTCAKPINAMVCSSAAAERAWSTFGFIHTPLRNRLANDKVEKVVFLYVNSAILDEKDKTNYILEDMQIAGEEFYG